MFVEEISQPRIEEITQYTKNNYIYIIIVFFNYRLYFLIMKESRLFICICTPPATVRVVNFQECLGSDTKCALNDA